MRPFILLALMAVASPTAAQQWEFLPGMTSAKLAVAGWRQDSAAGLSWPDGRTAVVSFWTGIWNGRSLTLRCVSFFDTDFIESGDTCKQAIGEDQ